MALWTVALAEAPVEVLIYHMGWEMVMLSYDTS